MKFVMFVLSCSLLFSTRYYVVSVHDGDTIVVTNESGKTKIRFALIDAPELKQQYGTNASNALASMILHQNVEVAKVTTDRYGRIIGIVFVNETNVNDWMVETGNAWAYKSFLKKNQRYILSYQSNAQSNHVGMWTMTNNLEPWKYRKLDKKKSK